MQQIRFAEAEELTAEHARHDCTTNPVRASLAFSALHAWAVGAQGRSEGSERRPMLAWAAAEAAGDPDLELDVLEHVSAARDEIERGEGRPIGRSSRRRRCAMGRWHQVVVAVRIQRRRSSANDDPRAALAQLEEAAEVGIGARSDRAGGLGRLRAVRGSLGPRGVGRGAGRSAERA